jgi:hypothetical protein
MVVVIVVRTIANNSWKVTMIFPTVRIEKNTFKGKSKGRGRRRSRRREATIGCVKEWRTPVSWIFSNGSMCWKS